jgi:hypothetical protein
LQIRGIWSDDHPAMKQLARQDSFQQTEASPQGAPCNGLQPLVLASG